MKTSKTTIKPIRPGRKPRPQMLKAAESAASKQIKMELTLPDMVAELKRLQKRLRHLHSSTTRVRMAAIGTRRIYRQLSDLEVEEEWFYNSMGRTLQELELYCNRNGLVIPATDEEQEGGEE